MANFIIKPASSGSTILQDEGGDAAITVAANGYATFAGTANNFGTISSDTTFPAGHIIQTTQVVKQDTFVMAGSTAQTETPIPGLSCDITPIKASSKILVNYKLSRSGVSKTGYVYMQRKIGTAAFAHLDGIHGTGDTALPAIGHAGGDNAWEMHENSAMYLDSPSYSLGNVLSYRIGVRSESTDGDSNIWINKTRRDNTLYHPRAASIIILMEVAG